MDAWVDAWYVVAALGLLAIGGLTLAASYASLERRASDNEESTRRAHLRLDNQQRQLEAMAKDLGWADNHAHTKVITQPLYTVESPIVAPGATSAHGSPKTEPESAPPESEPTRPSVFDD